MEKPILIDTHAHFGCCITDAGYSEETLFLEMAKSGVTHAVQISTERSDFVWSVSFAEKHRDIMFTLGIHPTSPWSDDDLNYMDGMLHGMSQLPVYNKLFGIGEIGLDYYWEKDKKQEQVILFERQLAIAKKYHLPIIVHSRDALDDTKDVIRNSGLNKGIIHCFSGTINDARDFLDLGFHISFAGNLTYKKAVNLHEAVSFIPADRLFLETDCPYLSAQPVRGQKNQPAWVWYTYQFAADKRGVPVEELAEQIYCNYKVFTDKESR